MPPAVIVPVWAQAAPTSDLWTSLGPFIAAMAVAAWWIRWLLARIDKIEDRHREERARWDTEREQWLELGVRSNDTLAQAAEALERGGEP